MFGSVIPEMIPLSTPNLGDKQNIKNIVYNSSLTFRIDFYK